MNTFSNNALPVLTHSGLKVLPDIPAANARKITLLPELTPDQPAKTLDTVLNQIAQRYNNRTAEFVALQLEYQYGEIAHSEK